MNPNTLNTSTRVSAPGAPKKITIKKRKHGDMIETSPPAKKSNIEVLVERVDLIETAFSKYLDSLAELTRDLKKQIEVSKKEDKN